MTLKVTVVRVGDDSYETTIGERGAISVKVDGIWHHQQMLRASDELGLSMVVDIIVKQERKRRVTLPEL